MLAWRSSRAAACWGDSSPPVVSGCERSRRTWGCTTWRIWPDARHDDATECGVAAWAQRHVEWAINASRVFAFQRPVAAPHAFLTRCAPGDQPKMLMRRIAVVRAGSGSLTMSSVSNHHCNACRVFSKIRWGNTRVGSSPTFGIIDLRLIATCRTACPGNKFGNSVAVTLEPRRWLVSKSGAAATAFTSATAASRTF